MQVPSFATGTHWREDSDSEGGGRGRVGVLSACKAPAQVAWLRLRRRARDPAEAQTPQTCLQGMLCMSLLVRLASSWRVVTKNGGIDLLVHSRQKPEDRPLETKPPETSG